MTLAVALSDVAGSVPDGLARPSFSLVVPLYNEEERFVERAGQLASFIAGYPAGSELVFVDDGSTDRTASLVADFVRCQYGIHARLISCRHQGKGAAVRAGLEVAEGAYAGFCDIDLSTPLVELDRMVRSACNAPVLVIGSRDMPGSNLVVPEHAVREFLGRCYNRLVRLTLTPGIRDTQCGAKVAAASVWRAILPRSAEAGFAWDVEALAIARRLGIPIWEVPVEWHHDSRSRVRPGRDGAAMVFALPRIWSAARAARPAAVTAAQIPRRADSSLTAAHASGVVG